MARARWRALLTDATVVSRSSATSVACQRRTSRRISTARWRAGRCWRAVTKARRMRLLGLGHGGGVAVLRQHPTIGDRRDPGVLVPGGSVPDVGLSRRSEVHGQGPALAATEHVEAHVGGDPVDPRPDRGAALEAVHALPGPDHRLLDGVLGLEGRAQHPVAVAGELPAVLLQVFQAELGAHGVGTDGHGREV